MGPCDYALSTRERMYFIILELLTLPSESWVSSQKLADGMYVARNTVINDIKAVQSFLASRNARLISRSKYGMRVEVAREIKLEILVTVFTSLLAEKKCEESFFINYLTRRFNLAIPMGEIARRQTEFLRRNNSLVSPSSRNVMTACMFVMLNFGIEAYSDAQMKDAPQTELDLIGRLIKEVCAAVGPPHVSATWIDATEQMILTNSLAPQVHKVEDFDLYCAVTHFLLLVGRDLNIDLQNDGLLVESLISHVKGFADWSSDDFDIGSDIAENTLMSMVMAAARPHFSVIEHFLHYPLNDNMKASLIVHVCAALYRGESERRTCRVRVVSVGSGAAGNYLAAQVKRYFNLDIASVDLSADVFDSQNDHAPSIDFIISTVPINSEACPVAVVSPVLSIEDINAIQKLAFTCSKADESELEVSSRGLAAVASIFSVGNRKKVDYLNRAIGELINQLETLESRTKENSPLLDLLNSDGVRIENGPLRWKDAILLASERLQKGGFVQESYVEKAISNVEEYGSYIVVNQGIALAHAGSEDGVEKDGISLLICPDGIQFDDIDDAVHLMFFFSQTKGGEAYLGLFQEVIKLGNNRIDLASIRFSKSSEEAYQRIVEVLTDYSASSM
ncbi:hypothetical protein HMPREF2826_04895 [Olsenella sp. HMSC062G07]|nr:hypothetical protein HMPREF2826_04895 [Olsenella sp. HMSC062G07]